MCAILEARNDLRRLRPALRGMGLALLAVASSGCMSFSYVDDNNVRHIVGLVHVAIDPGAGHDAPAARMIDLSGVGVSIQSVQDIGHAFTIGYARQRFLILTDNSCVDLDISGPCKMPPKAETKEFQ
jgi:hypothetical protein